MDHADPDLQDHERHRRMPPARQAPLRRPPLGLPTSVGSAVNSAFTAAVDSGAAVGSGMQGFVERGVDTAYQVIDAYMRRGLEAAQRQAPFAFGAASAPGGSAPGPMPPLLNPSWAQAASSLAGPWAQLVRAWVDGLESLAPALSRAGFGDAAAAAAAAMGGAAQATSAASAAAPAPPSAGASAASPADQAPRAASPSPKMTIEIMSRQVTEATLELEPGADLAVLRAAWEGQADSPVHPATLTFYSEPGHVHLRLTLAESALPGRHEARVTDRHGQCWGRVAVTIADCG
jgi:hypothetical protein